jgi:hypothetical protein
MLDENKNAKKRLRFYFVKDNFKSFELWLLPQGKVNRVS